MVQATLCGLHLDKPKSNNYKYKNELKLQKLSLNKKGLERRGGPHASWHGQVLRLILKAERGIQLFCQKLNVTQFWP